MFILIATSYFEIPLLDFAIHVMEFLLTPGTDKSKGSWLGLGPSRNDMGHGSTSITKDVVLLWLNHRPSIFLAGQPHLYPALAQWAYFCSSIHTLFCLQTHTLPSLESLFAFLAFTMATTLVRGAALVWR